MKYNDWPEYLKKRYVLTKIRIGNSDPHSQNEPGLGADEAINSLYSVLTTLDTKASALMRLNGVLIAAAAFLLGLFGRNGKTVLAVCPFDAYLITGSAVLSAISIFACLFVVRVEWAFLGKISLDNDNPSSCDCKSEILSLDKACSRRANWYRAAWRISAFASAGFVLEFILQAIHVVSVRGMPV